MTCFSVFGRQEQHNETEALTKKQLDLCQQRYQDLERTAEDAETKIGTVTTRAAKKDLKISKVIQSLEQEEKTWSSFVINGLNC